MLELALAMNLSASEAVYLPSSISEIARLLELSEAATIREIQANAPMRAYVARTIQGLAA